MTQALIARVIEQLIQLYGQGIELSSRRSALRRLLGQGIELSSRRSALRRCLSLRGLQDTLQLLKNGDRALNALRTRRDRGDALVDVALTGGQVIGAVGQRLA